jgi:hypothetical protein
MWKTLGIGAYKAWNDQQDRGERASSRPRVQFAGVYEAPWAATPGYHNTVIRGENSN